MNTTQGELSKSRVVYSLMKGKKSMQPYPKLTRERLAALPNGTHLKLGGLLVKLTGRGQFVRGDGSTEDVIEYVDASGTPGSFTESVFLDAATEHLNATRCFYCGEWRDKGDCVTRTVEFYMSHVNQPFCADKKCAETYFLRNPNRTKHPRRVS